MIYPPSAKGRFGPLKDDHWLVGTTCHLCDKPLEAGQVPSLVGDVPADEEEAAKKAAGRAYNAVAEAVHENCVYPE